MINTQTITAVIGMTFILIILLVSGQQLSNNLTNDVNTTSQFNYGLKLYKGIAQPLIYLSLAGVIIFTAKKLEWFQ